jgi:hypothetical protein
LPADDVAARERHGREPGGKVAMKFLACRSLLVATCLFVSMPALATPVVDGFLGGGEYANSFVTGWYNGHASAGSQFQQAGDHTTTVYWEDTGNSFYLYLEAPLAAKNLIWGAGFTDAEALSYYQHWCSPDDGNPAAPDGSNCGHHSDGFAKFQADKLDFDTMTKSEKVVFAGFKADLAGDASADLFGADLREFQDSVDYALANLGCDTTDCDASNTPMAFEFKFAFLDPSSINDLIEDIKKNELEIHLSPERGAAPVPEPSSPALFGLGLLVVGRSLRNIVGKRGISRASGKRPGSIRG